MTDNPNFQVLGATETSGSVSADQIVIYGANGWMGRSAVEFISSNSLFLDKKKILLIGSKSSSLEVNNHLFDVNDPITGSSLIRENAILLNAAFLRREFLQKMSSTDYRTKNEEVSLIAEQAIKSKKLLSFINLSSGAARELDNGSPTQNVDEYSRMKKKFELKYSDLCEEKSTNFINCRIFSLSGKHINEFENLALSSFIQQAKQNNRIEVKSPTTKRTYLDATELAGTLFKFAIDGRSAHFDSGGVLVTLLELAEKVADLVGGNDCEIVVGGETSPDYYGDYEGFENLVSEMGQTLSGIEGQVLKTAEAFANLTNAPQSFVSD
jgi:nucleoside-diphosphate-sugar epimerase